MTISDALDELWEKIKECNLDVGGMDNEDLIVAALQHLRDDAELEFSEMDDEDEFDYDAFHEISASNNGVVLEEKEPFRVEN